jgi:xanthosine utilization system XapX-like protein
VCFRAKPPALFAVCLLGLLNGYDVVHVPSIPGSQAVQSRWEKVTDAYTHRVGCVVRQTRALSGEPSEDRLRAVERYCEGVPGTSLPSQPR